jgi:hypothetical protein
MKWFATILMLVTALIVGACTPPHFGVSLRFQSEDTTVLLGEVQAIAVKLGFTDEAIAVPKHGDWEVILSMRGKRIVRREALSLMVVKKPEGLSIGVGRMGGLALSLRPEEITLIRDLCGKLQALRGYSGVERENGMKLSSDASKRAESGSRE